MRSPSRHTRASASRTASRSRSRAIAAAPPTSSCPGSSGRRSMGSGLVRTTRAAPYPFAPRLVGPRRPLERLLAAFERAAGGGGAALVALEGPPGAGKSRLLVELAQAAGERARYFHAGAADPSLPFAPFVRILMS